MKLSRIMIITGVKQLSRRFLTKTSVVQRKFFQKNSAKSLLQSHTIHKFASKYEYQKSDDNYFCFQYLEPDVDVSSLTGGNKSLEKKLKMILYEIYNYRREYSHPHIPDKLLEKHYRMLLNIPTEPLRKKFLNELYKYNLRHKSNDTSKNMTEIHKPRDLDQINIPGHIWYQEDHNAILPRIKLDEVEERILDSLSYGEMLYGDNIIIDLSYEDNMEIKEASQCLSELRQIIYFNKLAPSHFNIHLCNVNRKGKTLELFQTMFQKALDDIPVNVHEKNYLDIFEREKLVYLTPHAHDELLAYDPNHIYIIGGVFDKFPFNHPYSYNKAISENVTVRRFPLDEILNWKQGSKMLGMYTSFKILSDLSYYKNWHKAFENLNLRYVENHRAQSNVYQFRNILTALQKQDAKR